MIFMLTGVFLIFRRIEKFYCNKGSIGEMTSLHSGKITDESEPLSEEDLRPTKIINKHVAETSLSKLQVIKPLGAGGFGMVKLVQVEGVKDRAFALKCIQKARVVQYGQQRHIMDEKNILMLIDSPFILGLHKTFKDNKFVYLLTDAYLGGDLWRKASKTFLLCNYLILLTNQS